MKKRQGKRAFGGGNDSSDGSDDEQGFKQYVQEKRAKISHSLPESNQGFENGDLYLAPKEVIKERKPSVSKFIGNFMAAKEQRNLDKLYHESLRAEMEIQKSGTPQERYLTESYKDRRQEMEDASKAARQEEVQEKQDMTRGRPLQTLLMNQKVADEPREYDQQTDVKKRTKSYGINGFYRNDVYIGNGPKHDVSSVPERLQTLHKEVSQLPQNNRKKLIELFLVSTKSAGEIERQRRLYHERVGIKS
ncbi:LADA_0F07536g1_1 [Lachancea dasiensis]|uniref:LADA_0F07536g1_1 n=1 Tax=Lachancea dasiensis TaxID=1072105 RepID=A0A1G4JKI3_9SACH|nr:LADA_0F07536g1_1 [Lachancea dasiensis]